MSGLSPIFFSQSTEEVARQLLGCILIHQTPQGACGGRIVETEAYLADDPASHSFKGKGRRNEAMFGPAGTVYVYRIYGMHLCLNLVTADPGTGEAVLIRALEPTIGLETMVERRHSEVTRDLCRGPGRLAQALGIDMTQNGDALNDSPLLLKPGPLEPGEAIAASGRIGISLATEKPLRFFLSGNRFVSGRLSASIDSGSPLSVS